MVENEILIQGMSENIMAMAKVLALSKGSNLLFPYRKIVVKDGSIFARQMSSGNVVYSQAIFNGQKSGSEPFLKVSGEGDVMFDMSKILAYLGELMSFKEPFIRHNTETKITKIGGIDESGHSIEWDVMEPIVEIDDASGIISIMCTCNKDPKCQICGGKGEYSAPQLSYKTKMHYYSIGSSPYGDGDVKLEIEAGILKAIGDRTEKLFEQFPMQFDEKELVVHVGRPEDIGIDKFHEVIPVQYVKNKVPSYKVVIGTYYKYVFPNLSGKITLFAKQDENALYVSMDKPDFHTGVLISGVMAV